MGWASARCKPQGLRPAPRRVALPRHASLRDATQRPAAHRTGASFWGPNNIPND